MDRRLFAYTRFFGAASVISEALDCLTTALGRIVVSGHARAFLSSLGSDLERLNSRYADSIERGHFRCRRLDSTMVNIEQSMVQCRLTELRTQAPRVHQALMHELDRLLSLLRFAEARSAGWALLKDVLISLRRRLRRPIEFSLQHDREAIGNMVIALLKRAPEYSANGVAVSASMTGP